MTSGGIRRSFAAWAGLAFALFGGAVQAAPHPWQLNMERGASTWSQVPYHLNNISLGVCVVIGVLVFGAMFIAMFRFRKSRGAVAETWSHNTKLEIVWTTIPVLILIVLAYLATGGLTSWADTTGSQMTVKVTGYQWMWKYEYLGEDVAFTSRLAADSNRFRQSGQTPTMEANPHYLLDVDNPLVLPVDTKVRFVITADDVIHAWWVPALGWKQDAIPGIVNEAWTDIREPGLYRGQCAELCGKDHGFMPIVVKAVPKAEFAQWLAAQKAGSAPVDEPSVIDPAGTGNAPSQIDPDLVEDVIQGEEPTVPAELQPDVEAAPADDGAG